MGPDFIASIAAAAALALGTLVSEDLTCITAGVMIATGRLGPIAAVSGCFLGIMAGDLLLFLAGRLLGRRTLALRLVTRFFTEEAIERSSSWLRSRGAAVVLITRLVPGTRLPMYLAAGALRTDGWKFAGYFALAAAIWTPLLVGVSAVLSAGAVEAGLLGGRNVLVQVVALGLLFGFGVKAGGLVLSWRGRRRLFASWQRLTRWEFWPPYVFYPPLLVYIACLMIRHRSLTVFTAANPAIVGGGFIGESKVDILRGLRAAKHRLARTIFVPGHLTSDQRIASAQRLMEASGLSLPVVLKPNQGQRGSGVVIVGTPEALVSRLSSAPFDLILQEYAPGHEFGVFYYRRPSEDRGRIYSLTEKRFPGVVGDGRRSLEDLILADDRAVCLEQVHRNVHRAALQRVPAAGERVQLVDVGSHCRGSLFLDAADLVTPELEDAFDAIARTFEGFYFGRFDVRTPSIVDFRQGRNFKIVELNGVTSEATHIYDPGTRLWPAYRVLARQWRLAFEIGAENHRRGAMLTPVSDLIALTLGYRRLSRLHPPAMVPQHVTDASAAASKACHHLLYPPETTT